MTVALIVFVLIAAFSDVKTKRIPNWITIPGFAFGLILQCWYGGWHGGIASITGAMVGFGIFIVLYLFAHMGAGDVKLFSAVGAFVGPQTLIIIFVLTALLGGVAALALAAARGRLRQTIERTATLVSGARIEADV